MKRIFITLFLVLVSAKSFANVLEAKPIADLTAEIAKAKFTYKETGLIFGYTNLKSCLYVSDNVVVLKNYCSPRGNYPAKSYTIISPKFGMIDLYQENFGPDVQRDIFITVFPDALREQLPPVLSKMKISSANQLIETLHYKYGPSCWSTNLSYYTQAPEVKCTINPSTVESFEAWGAETQAITGDAKTWNKFIEDFDKKFPYPAVE